MQGHYFQYNQCTTPERLLEGDSFLILFKKKGNQNKWEEEMFKEKNVIRFKP